MGVQTNPVLFQSPSINSLLYFFCYIIVIFRGKQSLLLLYIQPRHVCCCVCHVCHEAATHLLDGPFGTLHILLSLSFWSRDILPLTNTERQFVGQNVEKWQSKTVLLGIQCGEVWEAVLYPIMHRTDPIQIPSGCL